MKATTIPISLICVTSGSQSRAVTDRRTVEEYAEAWKADADFPPVDLFVSGSDYFPGDGIHRILGARMAGRTVILAYVYRGDERDAFLHACSANHAHGLRRTNQDKRHMVTRILNDKEWVKWSDRRIADQCGVSAQFVANVRGELTSVEGSAANGHAAGPRIGADGKLRKRPESSAERRVSTSPASISIVRSNTSRDDDCLGHAAQRQRALAIIESLRKALMELDLYECCSVELQSIRDQVSQNSLAEMIA